MRAHYSFSGKGNRTFPELLDALAAKFVATWPQASVSQGVKTDGTHLFVVIVVGIEHHLEH